LQLNSDDAEQREEQCSSRTIPIDLAAAIGLFWASLAVAAGNGPINRGPVMVIGYIGALWQALALFGGFGELGFLFIQLCDTR